MGMLNIDSFTPLRHASGALDDVTISVFAYASDITLSVPTVMAAFTPQSGYLDDVEFKSQADEHGSGIISRPASAVAKAAGWLANVPILRPFAKATEIAANAVSGIASIFGFSRPVVLTNPSFMKNTIMGNLSNVDAHEAVSKLSLDGKQELCIDPRTVGLDDVDELAIDTYCAKESYLTTSTWAVSDTPGTLLFQSMVMPVLFDSHSNSTMLMTPMCHLSQLFQYWRGTIRYRFQIVASSFHKGRLAVIYDPNGPSAGLFTNYSNVAYTRYVDLAKERDFAIDINWAQHEPYAKVLSAVADGEDTVWNTAAVPLADNYDGYRNGTIMVKILNELAAPAVTADVTINVFVSGHNMDFAAPNSEVGFDHTNQLTFMSQSGEVADDEFNSPEDPQLVESVGTPCSKEDFMNTVYFGESIKSIRSLLKRYTNYRLFSVAAGAIGTDIDYWRIIARVYPAYAGYDTNGMDTTAALDKYNYVGTSYINYFTPCFTLRRGGIRYKFHPIENGGLTFQSVTVQRTSETDAYTSGNFFFASAANISQNARSNISAINNVMGGAYITDVHLQSGIEVEFPFYSNKRAAYAKTADVVVGLPADNTDTHTYELTSLLHDDVVTATATGAIQSFVAAGDDYTLFFFSGVPPIQKYANPAAI